MFLLQGILTQNFSTDRICVRKHVLTFTMVRRNLIPKIISHKFLHTYQDKLFGEVWSLRIFQSTTCVCTIYSLYSSIDCLRCVWAYRKNIHDLKDIHWFKKKGKQILRNFCMIYIDINVRVHTGAYR